MNKSKFLKRSLAALLAILMVVAMIPSALAADDDETEGQDLNITVDTYRATRNGNDYEVTVYDSNDVTIAWAPIAGTDLKLVTKDGVSLDLPYKLYLAENADVSGDTYTVTLRETVGTADPVDHKLRITVGATVADDDATLASVRVDNASGNYGFGYLNTTAIPGYISDVTTTGIKAHAISGVIDEANNIVTITLPFGMTPTNVGLGTQYNTAASAEKIFAPHSIHAKSKYVYNSDGTGEVTVTAKTNVVNQYKVVFKNEKIFDSFANADVSELDDVVENSGIAKLTVKLPVDNLTGVNSGTTDAGKWIPEFTITSAVKRIMGDSMNANVAVATANVGGMLIFSSSAPYGEYLETSSTNGTLDQKQMLKVITSKHASWTTVSGTDNYVYLLVRTKANPSGAWVEVNLHANGAPKSTGVYIKELQIDNVQSVTDITADQSTINVTVDSQHSNLWGNTAPDADHDDSNSCYLRVTTSGKANVTVPDQDWTTSTSSTTAGTRHLLTKISAKSGSFTLRVKSEDGTIRDYTIRVTQANSQGVEISRIELRDGDNKVVAKAVKGSAVTTPFELEIPYSYIPGVADATLATTQLATGTHDGLLGLKFYVYTSDGAMVVPGKSGMTGGVKATGRDNKTPITVGGAGPVDDPTVIENSITKLSDLWRKRYTSNNYNSEGFSFFGDTLYLTVSNVDSTGKAQEQVYEVTLKRGNPDEKAEITKVTANQTIDSDYIYSVATTLGTQITGQTDIGQAYIGAVDAKGNDLKVDIEQNAIKVHVPTDWTTDDTLYLTGLTASGKAVKRAWYRGTTMGDQVKDAKDDVLSSIIQEDQTAGGNGYPKGFKNLTTSASSASKYNILYVISEKNFYTADVANGPTITRWGVSVSGDTSTYNNGTNALKWLNSYAKAYPIYVVKDVTTNTGRTLNSVSSDKATIEFRPNYDAIKVTVPGSMNWTTGYREDSSKDFKLKFDTSAGAIVIDKGQYKADEDISWASVGGKTYATAGTKYDDTRNGTTSLESASEAEYLRQLNEHYQITDDTIFFVMGGELYIYDELTGDQIRVTGEGGVFTNTNWGQIKTKQAEIGVWNEAQRASINYRLDLVVGAKSNQNQILSLKVGDTDAAISGSSITATLPEDSDKEQALTITASAGATVSVNSEPYQSDLPIDLSKPATIVVTAEDGTEATYTLTVTFGGGTTPDPDKPSSKYTDLDKVTNDTMRDYVRRAIDMGLMSNTGREGIFDPMAIVSRKDFAVIIARADLMANNEDITNKDEADARLVELYGGEDAFDDISGCLDVQKAAIKYCAEKSYIAGDGKGGFNPNSSIERQAAAIILAKWRGLTVDESNTGNVNNVADWDKVANWAKPYVNAVMTDGLMSGTGNNNFTPAGANGTVNREQTAVMLVRVFDKKYPAFE